MKIKEAIATNSKLLKNHIFLFLPSEKDAIKLGIEALKWVKRYRPDNKVDRWSLLPGETKE